MAGEEVRSAAKVTPERDLRICDSKGLSWLVDLRQGTVLWLIVQLSPLRYRKLSEADAAGHFQGKIRIGKYTIIGAFSFATGETIRKAAFPGMRIRLVPDGNHIGSLIVAFVMNEKQADTGA
jgi:hypothetical protein